jgi:hypothetical protein
MHRFEVRVVIVTGAAANDSFIGFGTEEQYRRDIISFRKYSEDCCRNAFGCP